MQVLRNPLNDHWEVFDNRGVRVAGFGSATSLAGMFGLFLEEREQLITLLDETHCAHCDYDEAEGLLMNHCDACCRKLTRSIWQLVLLKSEWAEMRKSEVGA